MRIKHHYFIIKRFGIINFLEKYCIPYELTNLQSTGDMLCTFDLYEDQEFYKKFRLRFPYIPKTDSIISVEYTKEEIDKAEWLYVRSKSTKVQWEYDEGAFNQLCAYKRPFINGVYYKHLEQVDFLSASKPVKWGNRQFFSGPNAADDILFCSKKAKELLKNTWQGLEFWPVKKYNTSKYIEDLYQVFFSQCLPIEAIGGGSQTVCSTCGRKVMRLPEGVHQLEISRQYLQNPSNVYRIGNVLIEQRKGQTTSSVQIVSQEFYQFCEKNEMNRGMIYEPVKLKV